MKKLVFILLVLALSGCASIPTTLTSKEQQWTIPAGTKFTAIQLPNVKVLTEFTADEDLAVMYKGTLLDLEVGANKKVLKDTKKAKTTGAIIGALGGVMTICSGLFFKNATSKIDFSRLFSKKKISKKK